LAASVDPLPLPANSFNSRRSKIFHLGQGSGALLGKRNSAIRGMRNCRVFRLGRDFGQILKRSLRGTPGKIHFVADLATRTTSAAERGDSGGINAHAGPAECLALCSRIAKTGLHTEWNRSRELSSEHSVPHRGTRKFLRRGTVAGSTRGPTSIQVSSPTSRRGPSFGRGFDAAFFHSSQRQLSHLGFFVAIKSFWTPSNNYLPVNQHLSEL
jgi:hypothetical protein